jgi:DNA-binding transcriptional MocR family regulator
VRTVPRGLYNQIVVYRHYTEFLLECPLTPQYRSIAKRLRRAVASGALRAGDRITSARKLAQRESVSLPTAVAALRVLEFEGLIVARPRSGYFVCGAKPAIPEQVHPPEAPQPVMLSALMRTVYDHSKQITTPLATAFPDGEWLPQQALQRALQTVARRIGAEAFAYSSPPGRLDLRRQIAAHASAWGADFGPQDLVITAGETQAMRLALEATCRRGDLVAIESPAYFGLLLLLESLGLRAVEVPTDPQRGMELDELARILSRQRIAAIVACPTAHNPLGATMPVSAKRELVKLLERARVPLIEDDVYGDLVAGEPRAPACKAFDESGNVLYCSSISKTLAPGWRIGWIAAGRYQERVLQGRWEASLAGSPQLEAALCDVFASGEYRRHLRRFRPKLSAALRAIAARVEASFPRGTRIARPAAGYLLWVELPAGVDALDVHRRALAEGISVAPGHLFSPGPRFTHHLRLNCANRITPGLLHAIDRLGQLCGR